MIYIWGIGNNKFSIFMVYLIICLLMYRIGMLCEYLCNVIDSD